MLQEHILAQHLARKKIIYEYYLGHSADETAEKYNISRMRVYHIATELRKLNKKGNHG